MSNLTSSYLQKEYLEILSLTRELVSQEYLSKEIVTVTSQPEVHSYFKEFSSTLKKTISQPAQFIQPHYASSKTQPTPQSSTPSAPIEKVVTQTPAVTPPQSLAPQSKITKRIISNPPNPKVNDQKEVEVLSKSIPPGKTKFHLEKLGQPVELDLKEFPALMQSHFPNYPIRSTIPVPKIISKPIIQNKNSISPVVILSFYEDLESQTFLKNVAQAIQDKLLPAMVFSALRIEREKKWESLLQSTTLQLIIIPSHRIPQLPLLQNQYHLQEGRIGSVPIISIADPSEYLKSPSLKSELWQTITRAVKSLNKT
jgi:hypothetical protein